MHGGKNLESLRRQMERSGAELPDWLDPPELPTGLEFYYTAFWDLDSERQIGMGVGPIPRSKIIDYAISVELDFEATDDLIYLIRAMDVWHLTDINKKKDG